MSPTSRPSAVPGIRNAMQAAPPVTTMAAAAENAASASEARTGPPPRPPKPVRYTLDLPPDDHRFLKRFAVDAEVDASVIMRALLGLLREDPQLAERVREAAWSR